jgi:hypothetical protein
MAGSKLQCCREEGGGVAFVEIGDVAANGLSETDGGVVAGVDMTAKEVAGAGAADGLGKLYRAAMVAAVFDHINSVSWDARWGMAEENVDVLRNHCELFAEAVGREHERPIEENR